MRWGKECPKSGFFDWSSREFMEHQCGHRPHCKNEMFVRPWQHYTQLEMLRKRKSINQDGKSQVSPRTSCEWLRRFQKASRSRLLRLGSLRVPLESSAGGVSFLVLSPVVVDWVVLRVP